MIDLGTKLLISYEGDMYGLFKCSIIDPSEWYDSVNYGLDMIKKTGTAFRLQESHNADNKVEYRLVHDFMTYSVNWFCEINDDYWMESIK